MSVDYLEWTEKWDKPTVYWPILTFAWMVCFLLYIYSNNLYYFYLPLLLTVVGTIGTIVRNYIRKKKK